MDVCFLMLNDVCGLGDRRGSERSPRRWRYARRPKGWLSESENKLLAMPRKRQRRGSASEGKAFPSPQNIAIITR